MVLSFIECDVRKNWCGAQFIECDVHKMVGFEVLMSVMHSFNECEVPKIRSKEDLTKVNLAKW